MTDKDYSLKEKTVNFFYKEPEINNKNSNINFLKLGAAGIIVAFLSFSSAKLIHTDILTNNFIYSTTEKNLLITEISKIKPDEFILFNEHLNKQKFIYDDKVNFLSSEIVNAYQNWTLKELKSGNDVLSPASAKSINNELADYHESIDDDIKLYNSIYSDTNKNNFSKNQLKKLLTSYEGFKNNNFYSNSDIEKEINSYLYTGYTGNVIYFKEHDTLNKIKEFDTTIKNKF